ncbi:MAG: thioredoxin-disulfide reductase [Actinobacteria bacterium]|nr:thioredoxin-disulfide reductase [Actinomycetota bacterium]
MERSVADERNVVILGSGPAGLTAALYAARANLRPLVLKGVDAGGQLMLTTEVENFPGFPDAILGPDLMERMEKQAGRFEAELLHQAATRVDLSGRPFGVWAGDEEWRARTLIVATGASAKWLGVPGEDRLRGRGVSSCATCDGFFFRGEPLVVVGGGDSAVEEAIFLTRFATKVTVVHRRGELRASKIMQDRAFANEKIDFVWNTVVDEVLGDGAVQAVRVKDVTSGATTDIPSAGMFVAIGHTPNTSLFEGQLEMAEGFIVVEEPTTRTSVPGAFGAGDVVDVIYRQAITAAGMGCKAAMDAERFLEAEGH